jgi:hypothetical protein
MSSLRSREAITIAVPPASDARVPWHSVFTHEELSPATAASVTASREADII